MSEQDKPPDFVLEIGSRSTGQQDAVEQRAAYAGMRVPEYQRFNETGEFHGTRLVGDRLADGGYEPVPIETGGEGVLQGYSTVLTLHSPVKPRKSWAGTARKPWTTSS